jgi:hypothetical protein
MRRSCNFTNNALFFEAVFKASLTGSGNLLAKLLLKHQLTETVIARRVTAVLWFFFSNLVMAVSALQKRAILISVFARGLWNILKSVDYLLTS